MAETPTKRKRAKRGQPKPYRRASDDMWCIQVELPRHGGQRRRKTLVRADKAVLMRAYRDFMKDLSKVGDLPTSSPTLAQWCDTWWERYGMTELKVSTRPSYESKIEQYIKPAIGKVRLDHLTVDHVHTLHNYVVVTKGLSPTSAKRAQAVLSSVLREAEREGKVARNVAKIAAKPKTRKAEVEVLTSAQARRVLESCAGTHARELARWGVAFLAGLRQSEALGLTWDMVDLEAGTITVAWQLKRLKWEHGCEAAETGGPSCGKKTGGGCRARKVTIPSDQEAVQVKGGLWLLRPKTSTSWREFPVPALLLAMLSEHMKASGPGGEHELVFHVDGDPIDHRDDSAAWHARLAAARVPDVEGHSARHTCNTILAELRVDSDVRQAILGHANDEVNKIYVHTSDARVRDALDGVAGVLDWRGAGGAP